uniref:Uncharacterized protein n=1 Tax=Aegilops tauschii subsp. strangulata TaxID=200361 RepID=A0A453RX95_AEGTS
LQQKKSKDSDHYSREERKPSSTVCKKGAKQAAAMHKRREGKRIEGSRGGGREKGGGNGLEQQANQLLAGSRAFSLQKASSPPFSPFPQRSYLLPRPSNQAS